MNFLGVIKVMDLKIGYLDGHNLITWVLNRREFSPAALKYGRDLTSFSSRAIWKA